MGYPAKSQIPTLRRELIAAAKSVAGVENVSVNMSSKIIAHAVQRGVQLLPNVKNIIAVASGKGGAAANLALALAAEGAQVGILDADIYGPSQPMMMGIEGRPESTDGKTMEPLENHGVQVSSIGFLVDKDEAMIWRGPMATQALEQLLRQTNWRDLDYLIPHVVEKLQALAYFVDHPLGYLGLRSCQAQTFKMLQCLTQGDVTDLVDRLALRAFADKHMARLLAQARARALRARLGAAVAGQFLAHRHAVGLAPGLELAHGVPAQGAGKLCRKGQFGATVHVHCQCPAFGQAQRGLQAFGQALALRMGTFFMRRAHLDAIDHHIDVVFLGGVELNRWRGGWSAQTATAFLFARDLRSSVLRTSLRAGECSPALKEKPHD
ncbi:hypothetical protein B566_EDAN019172 [Ephemera danica]|nr:hypothetical protein B566_EDAN019172 [Ephemera danica]